MAAANFGTICASDFGNLGVGSVSRVEGGGCHLTIFVFAPNPKILVLCIRNLLCILLYSFLFINSKKKKKERKRKQKRKEGSKSHFLDTSLLWKNLKNLPISVKIRRLQFFVTLASLKRGHFTSFSLSRCCCLHFCRNKFGLMLAQGYFKGQRSSIIHILQIFMTLWYAIIKW